MDMFDAYAGAIFLPFAYTVDKSSGLPRDARVPDVALEALFQSLTPTKGQNSYQFHH